MKISPRKVIIYPISFCLNSEIKNASPRMNQHLVPSSDWQTINCQDDGKTAFKSEAKLGKVDSIPSKVSTHDWRSDETAPLSQLERPSSLAIP